MKKYNMNSFFRFNKKEAEENSTRAFELSQVENKVRGKSQTLPYKIGRASCRERV